MLSYPYAPYVPRRRYRFDPPPREDEFSKFASAAGMVGIKGHRSVGGFRASLYNAMPKSRVEALVATMKEFEKQH